MEFLSTLEPIRSKEIIVPVLKKAGRHVPNSYPFGNPVSIERCHLPIVKSMQYWITEKTDGTRVCIMFVTTEKEVPLAILMDRTGNLYGFQVSCDIELFDGSILDAELMKTGDSEYTMYVFDVAMIEGEVLHKDPLSSRLELIEDVVSGVESLTKGLFIQPKKMFRLQKLDEFQEYIKASGHASDGFILTPELEKPPLPGTAWSIYKIKTFHTVDLLCVENQIWYGSGDELLRIDALPGWEVTCDVDVSTLPNNSIVEFVVTITESRLRLRPTHVRPDKTVPNNALCVVRTIASIRDAITLADLDPSRPS